MTYPKKGILPELNRKANPGFLQPMTYSQAKAITVQSTLQKSDQYSGNFLLFCPQKLSSCFELKQMAQFELIHFKIIPHSYPYKFVSSFRRLKIGCEFQGKG